MFKRILAIIILAAIFLTGCGKEDTPEDALNDIKIALAERDSKKLATRVDLDEFFSKTYDATTVELVKLYNVYSNKYPDDPYFQHSAEFLAKYNNKHKNLHLRFLNGVKKSFFDKETEPTTPKKNPTAYVANEFEKIRQATDATVKEVIVKDNHATIILLVEGDNSVYGKLIGRMTFKLGFRKEKEFWQLEEIENLNELTPFLVDKAELVWINL